jgi:hypothetical protein
MMARSAVSPVRSGTLWTLAVVDGAAAWLAAAFGNRSCEAAPFARDGGVDWERVEGRLDHAEPLGP